MRVYGVDFTSAPTNKKPIVVAECETEPELRLIKFLQFTRLAEFGAWLQEFQGTVGVDAPFGFPKEFRDAIGLSGTWKEQSSQIEALGLQRLVQIASEFRSSRPEGKKEPRRQTEIVTKAFSSMKMYQPPVGRMATRIIPLLARSGASVFPVRENKSGRMIFEIYCSPFARSVVGRQPYKNRAGTAEIRSRILSSLPMSVDNAQRKQVLDDDEGDFLDSLIGCYEAVLAEKKLASGALVLPTDVDRIEGWIVTDFS